ncbi:hypothetical protein TWF106_004858 [Orbilia oligospora]|uniref:Uncharacterized protein n=1 Tax=Orbilia oligospora TaxID=2813651 RepID=A0A6G1MEB3_ORBOL|nr:hypothetical protein TWF788_005030 [Orbilia oligospora]KAF3198863.1 hypothetical protein TWF679_001749 [Orbilia oligospora]KAF3223466.1 hypothetical protein TWF106_004858 [Orbilia oligospora]KAF3225272.1 hypothetical protein TWF191_005322 [Orbilia oligospora]KAF3254525.1 hypothetical protein TWF192_003287 [Orbilia oligospora]
MSSGSKYKPTENNGLKEDGTEDKRVNSEHGFGGQDRDHVSEMGRKGGQTQPDEIYKPSEHGGLKSDGTEDKRTRSDHGFGSRPTEEVQEIGRKGGLARGSQQSEDYE